MNETRRNSRVTRALDVIKLTEEGMTVVDACHEIGLPRSTYYFIIKSEREALSEYQLMKRAIQLEQILKILFSEDEILEKLIEKANSEDSSIKEIVSVLKYMDQKKEDLIQSQNLLEYDKDYVASILTGPKQVPGVSRFSTEPPLDIGQY